MFDSGHSGSNFRKREEISESAGNNIRQREEISESLRSNAGIEKKTKKGDLSPAKKEKITPRVFRSDAGGFVLICSKSCLLSENLSAVRINPRAASCYACGVGWD